jgi:hypothetical protein
MRTSLMIVLSILTGAALAQASVLSDKEVDIRWEKLMIVTSGETEKDQLEHLRSHGMGEDGARTLRAAAKQAQIEMREVFNQLYQEVCAKQKEIRESGGPEMLAQIIEQQKVRESAARRRLLDKASDRLSLADQERLEHLFTTDHGPNVGIGESDTAALIRNGQIPLERTIVRFCELEKSTRSSAETLYKVAAIGRPNK